MLWIIGFLVLIAGLLFQISQRLRPVSAYFALHCDLESAQRGDGLGPNWTDWHEAKRNFSVDWEAINQVNRDQQAVNYHGRQLQEAPDRARVAGTIRAIYRDGANRGYYDATPTQEVVAD